MTDLTAIIQEAQAAWRLRFDPASFDSDTMAGAILSALADPANRDALVAWLVEAGIAERPTYPAFGQEYRAGFTPADPDEPASVDRASMTLDPNAVPLYRFNRKGDRG